MECVLVRHGEASFKAPSDFERALTERGELQVRAAADWLAGHWQPEQVLVSPYLRARQTAAAFLDALPSPSSSEADFLTPDSSLQNLTDRLATMNCQRLLLIGHNPLFSNALTWFCGDALREVMAPASMALLDLPIVARDAGRLAWLRHEPDYSQVARFQL